MYFMKNSESEKKPDAVLKGITLKYIGILLMIIAASFIFTGCLSSASLANTPTPAPSAVPAATYTPAADLITSANSSASAAGNATPSYDETYPVPENIGNSGANIENGGLSASDSSNIYYIDSGIWSISKISGEKEQITDMQNISCLNKTQNYLYFLSSHDGSIYRVEKQPNSIPEYLGITGAGNLIIVGEYMYYSLTIGENATHYVYKSPLKGIVQECLFIKASYISPDGAYFYFNNLEDEGTLWRYDTISSQIVKIINDSASQINVIDEKIYYISQNSDYNVVCVDRSGLNQIVVVTQGCTDLNIIQNYLIYRTIDTGYIQSYNIKTGENVTLVSYGDLFALSATETKLFFQSCPADGFEPETYIYDISTSQLNKSLPRVIYAFIRDIDLDSMTFDYDSVNFYTDEEALNQYAAYNTTSVETAREALKTDDGTFYIYNKNEAWVKVIYMDWSNITLIRRLDSLENDTPYTTSLSSLQSLFDTYPYLEGKLLFEITILDKKVIEINEVYYTINTNN